MPGDPTHDDAHMIWSQWPKDIPRPTEDEWYEADKRYRAEMSKARERGYYGDGLCGLSFMMATFNRTIWWGFFFPEEDEAPGSFSPENQSGFALACRPSWYYKEP